MIMIKRGILKVRNITTLTSNKFEWGTVRLADLHDILQITNCNERNLTENYDYSFYHSQIRKYPMLNLIAENTDEFVVGYSIGRVILDNDSKNIIGGQITSIAIEESYRSMGIGTSLMNQLHNQFAFYYPTINFIELHCRISNKLAIEHYKKQYGYEIEDTIKELYPDNEDGYIMRLNNFPGCLHQKRKSNNGKEISNNYSSIILTNNIEN